MTARWLPLDDAHGAGGKARGLNDLLRWGLSVPPACVLRADDAVDDATLEAVLARLGTPLAVRSSAADEDGAGRSFAGMHDTVLEVRDLPTLREAVTRVRASGASTRAQAYRGAAVAVIPVVIQRMIEPTSAGVAFSVDPVSGRDDVCVIEAVAGLGEALVSGRVAGERAVVSHGGVVLESATSPAVLPNALAQRVAALTVAIRGHAGTHVDVEWAFDGTTLWALQWRPVTTALATGPRMVWTNTNAAEILPEVARPMTMDLVLRYVASMLEPVTKPIGFDVRTMNIIGQVGGRVYFNMNAALGWVRAFPFLRPFRPAAFAKILGGDQQALATALASLRPSDLPKHRVSVFRFVAGTAQVTWKLLRHNSGDSTAFVNQLRERLRQVAKTPTTQLSDDELLARIEDTSHSVFGTHDGAETMTPAMIGMAAQGLLPVLTRLLLRDRNGSLARRLLSGSNALDSAEPGRALLRLGALASNPTLRAAVSQPYTEARGLLSSLDEGRALLSHLDTFFELHGHHARGEADVSLPRWSETPGVIWAQVQALAEQQGRLPQLAQKTDQLELQRETLARAGVLGRWLLEAVLRRAMAGMAARENTKSEAIRSLAIVRDAILSLADRLVARGQLQVRDDVFFLKLTELTDAVRAKAPVATLIAERRALHALHESQQPPAVVVGTWAPSRRPPPPPGRWKAGTVVSGLAAGAGVAEGVARVITHATPDARVEPGEVLVAPFTDPGWAPLFVSARAIVMDFGGLLSHGAIVAREYGLPAVVNVGPATQALRTGQRIRVDGDAGTVTVLDD